VLFLRLGRWVLSRDRAVLRICATGATCRGRSEYRGPRTPSSRSRSTDRPGTRSPDDADILLSKTANPEQLRIARRLEHSGGSWYRDLPVPERTYTIGNLIGHLLAEGKSVLVTSHTTKALRMVRSQIVPELRSLGVSLLENDLDSRMQLESAVSTIAGPVVQDRCEVARTRGRRTYTGEGRTARPVGGVAPTTRGCTFRRVPRRCNRRKSVVALRGCAEIARESEVNGWIPGPIQADIDLPLSGGELAELYATNRSIIAGCRKRVVGPFTGPDELPSQPISRTCYLKRHAWKRVTTISVPIFGKVAVGRLPRTS